MTQAEATVANRYGIHCRPSAVIVKEMQNYTGKIQITAKNGDTNLTSVLGLVSLGLEPGERVRIQVDGPDEKRICQRIVELFETHFDFPRDQDTSTAS